MVIESTEDEPEEFESIHNLRTLKVSSKMLELFGKLQEIEQNGAVGSSDTSERCSILY